MLRDIFLIIGVLISFIRSCHSIMEWIYSI